MDPLGAKAAAQELATGAETVAAGLESTVQEVAKDATLNAADAVGDIVGAVDRLNKTVEEQSAAWLAAVTRLSDQIDRLLKGISLKVNE